MFKLIVLADGVVAEWAEEDATAVIPNAAFTFATNGFGTRTRTKKETFPLTVTYVVNWAEIHQVLSQFCTSRHYEYSGDLNSELRHCEYSGDLNSKLWIVETSDYISNHLKTRPFETQTFLSRFQMVGLPDFRSHSKSGPFATQPLFDHSKSKLVRLSDPRCIWMFPVFRCPSFNAYCNQLYASHDFVVRLLLPSMRLETLPSVTDPSFAMITNRSDHVHAWKERKDAWQDQTGNF